MIVSQMDHINLSTPLTITSLWSSHNALAFLFKIRLHGTKTENTLPKSNNITLKRRQQQIPKHKCAIIINILEDFDLYQFISFTSF